MARAQNKQKDEEIEEISELKQPIWGIIDGINCLAYGLTYHEAGNELKNKPEFKGTIVTEAVAARLPKL